MSAAGEAKVAETKMDGGSARKSMVALAKREKQ